MTTSRNRGSFIPGPKNGFSPATRGRSRMPELGPSGSVRGARGNPRPYRDQHLRGTSAEQAELLTLFKAVYGEDDIHVSDVDLFVGGLAEAPGGKSQMGSTFTWIFQEHLHRLQEGDRFYYFNQLKDSPLLLADIGSQHFSDIVMRNTGLDHL